MDQNTVASIISTRRKALGLTQQALADQLHISNKSVSKWETGEGLPDISILKDLASALQISVDELLGNVMAQAPVVTPVPNTARLVRLLTRLGIVIAMLFPFVRLTFNAAEPSGLGAWFDAIFGNNLTLEYTGYQLMINNSWIGRFVLICFILNLILLGLDLFRPTQDPEVKGLIKVAHWTLLGLAVIIPVSGLMMGLSLGIGLILNSVFLLSVSLTSLLRLKSK